MKEVLKEKFPKWYTEIELNNDLVLGDDSDSLLSCNLLKEITSDNWDVNYFYDFKDFYRHKESSNHLVGVDMAFVKNVKCFDNHVTRLYPYSKNNPHMINPNLTKTIAATKDYYKKYPFSTLMLIMALYDIPLPKSDKGKDIILAVDSSFKGHYNSNKFFKDIHTGWLEEMGYTALIDRLDENNPKHFYDIQKEFNLNGKISVDDQGKLQSIIKIDDLQKYIDFKLELPDKQFNHYKELNRSGQYIDKRLPDRSELVSLAYTGKNYASFTSKIKEGA
ncbi:hypothetical protein [Bacillus sp. Hm123]|uniref:hypothetical protein n=1 Tax=Bacillus sp. Hm123 TaxID=3450745 RepID=UPI003F4440BB